jgi:DinB family protein
MPRPLLTVDEIMSILRTTVPRLEALTDGLPPERLHASPGPDVWSANDNLAHLRASHDVLGGSILRILREDAPAWRRLSPRAWMRKTDYPSWAFGDAFAAFRQQRAELLAVLDPLPLAWWDRTARVTEPTGDVRDRTARFYGDWLAGHERDHVEQVTELLEMLGQT